MAAADSTELFLASMILYSFPCMVAWVNGQGKQRMSFLRKYLSALRPLCCVNFLSGVGIVPFNVSMICGGQ